MQQAGAEASRTLHESKLVWLNRAIKHKATVASKEKCKNPEERSACWVPHPGNGIYYPQGHERVMNDIPKGAASFAETYWLRNIDGVDKPDFDK